MFIYAASFNLLPNLNYDKEEIIKKKNLYNSLESNKNKRKYFDQPFGLAPGVVRADATSIDNLFEISDFGFVEIGPVTIDPQHQPSLKTNLIRIEDGEIKHKFGISRYSCNQVVYKLVEKQEILRNKIVAGQSIPFSNGKIGVCIEANSETLDSVPYLTHQDFQK